METIWQSKLDDEGIEIFYSSDVLGTILKYQNLFYCHVFDNFLGEHFDKVGYDSAKTFEIVK